MVKTMTEVYQEKMLNDVFPAPSSACGRVGRAMSLFSRTNAPAHNIGNYPDIAAAGRLQMGGMSRS